MVGEENGPGGAPGGRETRVKREIDPYSYQCGVMDAFGEMVQAGVKRIALSHPCAARAERDSYLPFAAELCRQYGIHCWPEDGGLVTDLFPQSLNCGCYGLVFYREAAAIADYRALGERKAQLLAAGAYAGAARRQLAVDLGRLLGYSDGDIDRLLAANSDREPGDGRGEKG